VLLPALKHGITAVDEKNNAVMHEGIRNLTVGNDFVMGGAGKEEKEKSPDRRYFLVIPRSAVLSAGRE
jgi:type IV secretory pathway protease TraF